VQSYEDERQELVSDARPALARRLFGLNSRLADRLCPAWADALVVISSYLARKYAAACGDAARVHLVPTLVDGDAWKLPPEREAGEPRVLYAGAFGEQDDVAGLVEALGVLSRRGRRFQAALYGANRREAGRVEANRRRVRELGLEARVTFSGFLPREALREEVARANLLYAVRRDGVWSRSGLSTKLSECLASGRAVVTSALGDAGDLLRDGEHALVVRAGAGTEEIAAALERGLGAPELRRRLGTAGRALALGCFDLDAGGRRLDAALAAIAPRRPGA